MAFGDPFARAFGGGTSIWRQEIQALLDAYAPGWDSGDATQNAAEVHGLALGIAMIWAINKRRAGIMVPARMLETLPIWEAACALRPLPNASIQARRDAVATRFLGFAGNAVAQIYDVCQKLCGSLFLGLATAATPASYSPGVNPGPPGAEWSSGRAAVAVQLMRSGAPDATFNDMVRRLRLELNNLCPSWMGFNIGTYEGGCIAGVGLVGLTLI